EAPDDMYERDFLLADETLGAAGFEHYEVSNYARPGRHARHNSSYWRHLAYDGLARAHTRSIPCAAAGTRASWPRGPGAWQRAVTRWRITRSSPQTTATRNASTSACVPTMVWRSHRRLWQPTTQCSIVGSRLAGQCEKGRGFV